ncbi:hypothetical protein TrispH2_004896 [Trichoplax sp. H2]|nr:hypothetical protein TrispH2_004896 [Trichoplax sp. H2]|eukprot:RDD42936.1 hypothetical protein TrispH2_004896 [Trichoplax sp. H2]
MDQDTTNEIDEQVWPDIGADLRLHADEFDNQYRRNSNLEMVIATFDVLSDSSLKIATSRKPSSIHEENDNGPKGYRRTDS